MGKTGPPTRAALSLVRALRDARGTLLFATGTSLSRRQRRGPDFVELEEFTDIGRNFRQPEQGLGFDNSRLPICGGR